MIPITLSLTLLLIYFKSLFIPPRKKTFRKKNALLKYIKFIIIRKSLPNFPFYEPKNMHIYPYEISLQYSMRYYLRFNKLFHLLEILQFIFSIGRHFFMELTHFCTPGKSIHWLFFSDYLFKDFLKLQTVLKYGVRKFFDKKSRFPYILGEERQWFSLEGWTSNSYCSLELMVSYKATPCTCRCNLVLFITPCGKWDKRM